MFIQKSPNYLILPKLSGCDHSRFLVVPDWYANGCCRVLALEQTQYSMLDVYLVFKNKVHKVQSGF